MTFEKNYLIVSIIFLLVIGYFVYSMYQDIIVLKNEMKSIFQEETENEEYESILDENENEEEDYEFENELMDEFENCFHGVKLETIQEEEPNFTEISEETQPLILEDNPTTKEKKTRKPRKAKETPTETTLEL